jgi:hypothetical protein
MICLHWTQAARYSAAYAALEHDAKGLRERTQQLDIALRQGKDRVSALYMYLKISTSQKLLAETQNSQYIMTYCTSMHART